MRVEDVLAWREALTCLSDQHFFDLMRMYLGQIKTPFNKQRLIEELSAFLRKSGTRERLVSALDNLDYLVLSAIQVLPVPTQQKIVNVLAPSLSFPDVYERILNLEERLVIYREADGGDAKRGKDFSSRRYAINPHLLDALPDFDPLSVLTAPSFPSQATHAVLPVDDMALAGLYSFFLHSDESPRNDGSLRKKTIAELLSVFPHFPRDEQFPDMVTVALRNLSLLVVRDGSLLPDAARWKAFAETAPLERLAYVIASVNGRYDRQTLQRNAQTVMDFVGALMPEQGYSREALDRLSIILTELSGRDPAASGRGRLAELLGEEASLHHAPQVVSRSLLELAQLFALVVEEDGVFRRNSQIDALLIPQGTPPALVVSPSFEAVLMPGSQLADILPLVRFMAVADMQTAGQFTISRHSCSRAFDQGETAQSILRILEKRSSQSLPGNLLFSVKDWYGSYSSLALFHGYVLTVEEGRRVLFTKGGSLFPLVRRVLAEGVYLLEADSIEEIQSHLAQAGFDVLPTVHLTAPHQGQYRFSRLSTDGNAAVVQSHQSFSPDVGLWHAREKDLVKALEEMNASPEIHEALMSRIERRIILSADQLDPDSVRLEKLEARGVDFLGKVRVFEHAIATQSLVEIRLDEKEGSPVYLGRALSLEKKTGDALAHISTEPSGEVVHISLSRAVLVKRIRQSLFSPL